MAAAQPNLEWDGLGTVSERTMRFRSPTHGGCCLGGRGCGSLAVANQAPGKFKFQRCEISRIANITSTSQAKQSICFLLSAEALRYTKYTVGV